MSFDLAVWSTARDLSPEESGHLFVELCENTPNLASTYLKADSAIQAFYDELTALHPEIDDVPEDRIDDHDYCPWSCAFDRSDRHIIMSCVWSQAENVAELVPRLATKHGLTVFDPQDDPNPVHPNSEVKKPWWKIWQPRPNPWLNSDPACIVFRSLSTSRYLGSAHRLGAGAAGQPDSLGRPMKPVTLKVLSWDDSNAFSANLSVARPQVRDALVDILLESTPMTRTAAKHLIREVLDKRAWVIPLTNPKLFEVFRNHLESIGATIDRPYESA